MKKNILMVGMLLSLIALTPLANAAVLSFDGLFGDVGNTYTQDRFILTADDSVFYSIVEADADDGYYYTGSETLMNDYASGTTLTSADGSVFSLTSIDLSEAFTGDLLSATTIPFDVIYKDGSTYSFDLTTDGLEGAQIFTFGSELTNLDSVSFGDGEYFQFDNVTASAVPVPSSILMLVAGLGALGCARKKIA
nr:VPLPA-CTERM sorting domain-containing protein [uncultured Desulfobacter sp.]